VLANNCPTSAAICSSLGGQINTYFKGEDTASLGSTTLTVTPRVAGDVLVNNDIVLIIQMQDCVFNTANDLTYGSGLGVSGCTSYGNVGLYEYNSVQSYSAGELTLNNPLQNTYHTSQTGFISSYQVIRVPNCGSAATRLTSNAFCLPWDGRSGGVFALIAGDFNPSGRTIDCSGSGFRGAAAFSHVSGATNPVIATTDSSLGARKGEGIAGAPSMVMFQGSPQATSITYPGGEYGQGAPGNAGGGGAQFNAAGGGGSNYGAGGKAGDADGLATTGGYGGISLSTVPGFTSRLFMGGGGGAGDANSNIDVHGGTGGGIVLIYAITVSSSATIRVDGTDGGDVPLLALVVTDGTGGGGAGGTIALFSPMPNAFTSFTLSATGGNGGFGLIVSLLEANGGGGGGGMYIFVQ
jgi:hypothetical protein